MPWRQAAWAGINHDRWRTAAFVVTCAGTGPQVDPSSIPCSPTKSSRPVWVLIGAQFTVGGGDLRIYGYHTFPVASQLGRSIREVAPSGIRTQGAAE